MSSVALKFRVSLDDLITANPEVNPSAMSIGQVLRIPSDPNNPSGEPTPTPAPFIVQQIKCYPAINKGTWCFVLAYNDSPDFMENLSAQVTLVDSNNNFIASQTALLPLNILPPNTSLPLAVYFPPDVPFDAKPQVQVLTAIRLFENDQRYLLATIHNTIVEVNNDGRYATVSGEIALPVESKAATQVWVAAVAYDENGNVVGVKRWEGGGIQPGDSLPFKMNVSSLGGEMTRVDFAVEARP